MELELELVVKRHVELVELGLEQQLVVWKLGEIGVEVPESQKEAQEGSPGFALTAKQTHGAVQ